MKLQAVTFLLILAAIAAFAQDDGVASIYGMQGIRVTCDTEWKHNYVRSFKGSKGFDFLKLSRNVESPIDVLVAADQLAMFKDAMDRNQINYEVVVNDMSEKVLEELTQQRIARIQRKDSDILGAFPRYTEIQDYLKKLSKTHSEKVQYISIGKSFEGRDIVGVKISSGNNSSDKPAVLIDAGIHAREWVAPTTAIYAIKELAENQNNSYLLENVDIYIIPSLNPDGYEYTFETRQSRMWRKTRSINENSRCLGVDGNRNFDFKWMTTGASDEPCDDTYAGPRPFSEPETAALREFVLYHRNIKMYLTFHSYGQYLLHPWGYTSALPLNEPTLRCVAEKAEAALSAVRGTRYTIGSSTNVLYAAAGGSDDWAMALTSVELSYTLELPSAGFGFAPPPREIIPIGLETFEAIKEFIKYAATEKC